MAVDGEDGDAPVGDALRGEGGARDDVGLRLAVVLEVVGRGGRERYPGDVGDAQELEKPADLASIGGELIVIENNGRDVLGCHAEVDV